MTAKTQGIAAYKAGDKVAAQRLLYQHIQENPKDDVAWLWFAASLNDPQKQRAAVLKCLEINPENAAAK